MNVFKNKHLGIQGGQAILSLIDSRIGFLGWEVRGLNLGATKFQVHHPCNVALVMYRQSSVKNTYQKLQVYEVQISALPIQTTQ